MLSQREQRALGQFSSHKATDGVINDSSEGGRLREQSMDIQNFMRISPRNLAKNNAIIRKNACIELMYNLTDSYDE